jgi:hypothetical protein
MEVPATLAASSDAFANIVIGRLIAIGALWRCVARRDSGAAMTWHQLKPRALTRIAKPYPKFKL